MEVKGKGRYIFYDTVIKLLLKEDTKLTHLKSNQEPDFFCYSTTLMHFLKANGLRYRYKTTHKRTDADMWVFARNDELRDLLDEYDERKAQARLIGRIGG